MPRSGTLRLGFLLTLLLCASILPARSGWKVVESQATVGVITSEARGVAYLASEPNTLYTTIEKAVEVANQKASGGTSETVYIVSGISGIQSDNLPNPIVIDEDLTISSGVTLCLPYDTATRSSPAVYSREHLAGTFSDATASSEKTNLKTEVLLEEGVEMTIEAGGKLIVGGEVGGNGEALEGQTSGDYAQVTLSAGASIVSSGSIECYGYIKPSSESVNDSTSLLLEPASSLTVPLVFYDFRGGNAMAAMYYGSLSYAISGNVKGIFPIEVFDFPNVSVPSGVEFGANLYVLGSLYIATSKTYLNTDPILLVGPESGAVKPIFGMRSGGTFDFDYVPVVASGKEEGRTYTVNDFTSSSKAKMEIAISGGAKMSDIVIPDLIDFEAILGGSLGSVAGGLLGGSRDVSTAGLKLPFSYKWDVTIDNGSYDFDIQAKFLPGSSVTVGENATARMMWSTIFYEGGASHASTLLRPYPSNLEGAKLVNNGILIFNNQFGAYIETEVEGSIVCFGGSREAASEREITGTPALDGSVSWTSDATRSSSGDIISGTSVSKDTDFPNDHTVFASAQVGGDFGYEASDYIPVIINKDHYIDGTEGAEDWDTSNEKWITYDASFSNGETYDSTGSSDSYVALIEIGGRYSLINLTNVAYAEVNGTIVELSGNTLTGSNVQEPTTINLVPRSEIENFGVTFKNNRSDQKIIFVNYTFKAKPSVSFPDGTKSYTPFELSYGQSGTVSKAGLHVGDHVTLGDLDNGYHELAFTTRKTVVNGTEYEDDTIDVMITASMAAGLGVELTRT